MSRYLRVAMATKAKADAPARPAGRRRDSTVKMDAAIVAQAWMIALARDVTIAEYLS